MANGSPPIHLAPGLDLPAETPVHRLAFIGTTGSGKSYAALKTAERMWAEGMPFVYLDIMGIAYGLRLAADGIGPGLPIVIFGGKRGDVPITEHDGGTVAEIVHSERISAVVDISEFETNAEKARFAGRFAERIYALHKSKPQALHLFLEEGHEYLPQNPEGGEAPMVGHWNRLWKQGGNFGLGGSIISQRPQDVNKKALELSALVLAFNTTGTNAVKAMRAWMGAEESQGLDALQPGECVAWSPSWLRIRERVRVLPRETFHARFDPLAFSPTDSATRVLAPVDLAAVWARMERVQVEPTDRGGASDADVARAVAEATAPLLERLAQHETYWRELHDIGQRLTSIASVALRIAEDTVEGASLEIPAALRVPPPSLPPSDPAPGLSRPQQAILDTLANLERIGVAVARKDVTALFSGASPTSGSFSNNLGKLRSSGLVEYPSGGAVRLTVEGRANAHAEGRPMTLAGLRERWYALVSGPQQAILRALVGTHPKAMAKDALAKAVGASATSGSYSNNLGRLRTLGLLDYPKPGTVGLTGTLFPEGLE